jgi:hypothetical protein
MDTFTNPEPTAHEPVPARDGREAPSRLRVLATSVAVAGLTATGGLAVILSTGPAVSGAVANVSSPARQPPAAAQASAATTAATVAPTTNTATSGTTADATTAPPTTATPAAASAPAATPQASSAAQSPQPASGKGPGHASSGGS